MRIISVHLTNFRLHADTRLIFPPEGLVGLSGPNESGKSTIPEAVMWALFGAAAIREKVEYLRWQRAGKSRPAKVVLYFEVGGSEYMVKRTETDAVLRCDGTDASLATGISGVDVRIPKIIGMSLVEFEATYLCGQGDLARISAMKPTARKRFFMSVLGVDRVESAIAACRTKKNAVRQYLEGLVAGLGPREPLAAAHDEAKEAGTEALLERSNALGVLRDAERNRDARADELKASEVSREAANALEVALGKAEAALTVAKTEVGESDERTGVVAKATKAIESHGDLDTVLLGHNSERTRLTAASTAHDQLVRVRAKLTVKRALVPDTVEYDEMKHEEAEGLLEKDRHALDLEGMEYATGNAEISASLRTSRSRLAELEDRKRALSSNSSEIHECPVCMQELTPAAVRDILALVDKEESTLFDSVETLTSESKNSDTAWGLRQTELQTSIAGRRTLIKRIETVRSEHILIGQLHKTIEELEADEDEWVIQSRGHSPERVAELAGLILETETAREERFEARFILETNQEWLDAHPKPRMLAARAQMAVSTIVKSLEELGFSAKNHRELALASQEAINVAWKAIGSLAAAEANLTNADRAIEITQRSLDEWQTKDEARERSAAELFVLRETDQRLGDFRTSMVEVIRPELEQLTSGFIGVLTDGRHGVVEIDDDYGVTLFENGVAQPVISGGAQSVVALAMRLAISQMIAERAGHPLSLMILDEPFGSIDVTRRQNVLDLLRRLRATFKQVLVISHSDDIQNAVDTCFDFTYDGDAGRSKVLQTGAAS